MPEKIKISEELEKALLSVVTQLEKDDQFIRERNIKRYKKAEEYWRLNQYVYWDEIALDYRAVTNYEDQRPNDDDNDQISPKTFPIYRAYGEAIIAAMAAAIPSVLFFPDDADNPDDVTTAKAYSNIAQLLQKHTEAPLLFIRILTILYNQGLVATYAHWKEDKKYGVLKIPEYNNETVQLQETICPQCQEPISNEPFYENDSSEISQEINRIFEKSYYCDNCGYEGPAEPGRVLSETIPKLVGYSENPKGRVCISAYGPLNVRISSYAKTQEDVGLLELQMEMHYAAARKEFPDIAAKIQATSDFYTYERWGRTSSELLSDELYNQVTVRYCWVREWAFHSLGDENLVKQLEKKFPNGCCVTFVNDLFAEVYDEGLDDYWTLAVNPLDSFIHGIPMGRSILDVQDAYNEAKNLGLQKYAFGLSETFVDSSVIDEQLYREQTAGPGYLTFGQAPPGRSMSDAFFQTRTTALNEEDTGMQQTLNADAQFLSGAVPSIFGGANVTGSKTASEYNQSRNFALQRFSNNWTNVKFLWANTMSKACRLFVTKMVQDEKLVLKNGNAFQTTWIRQAELAGKIGNVEPDVSEQFPLTWNQKHDMFMQMIQLQNPIMGQIFLHPNNAQHTKDALGFPDFYIPGEEDRTKQLLEIRKLSEVNPEEFAPEMMQSTVPVDPLVDDHGIHMEVIKLYCVSPEGMYLKETNPAAYMNILMHFQEHQQTQQMMAMMMQPPMPPPEGAPPQQ